jgi:hypothetical protein
MSKFITPTSYKELISLLKAAVTYCTGREINEKKFSEFLKYKKIKDENN